MVEVGCVVQKPYLEKKSKGKKLLPLLHNCNGTVGTYVWKRKKLFLPLGVFNFSVLGMESIFQSARDKLKKISFSSFAFSLFPFFLFLFDKLASFTYKWREILLFLFEFLYFSLSGKGGGARENEIVRSSLKNEGGGREGRDGFWHLRLEKKGKKNILDFFFPK